MLRFGCPAGSLEIAQMPSFFDRLQFRLSVAFGVWSEGDHRDWAAIRAWAESLRPLVQYNMLARTGAASGAGRLSQQMSVTIHAARHNNQTLHRCLPLEFPPPAPGQ